MNGWRLSIGVGILQLAAVMAMTGCDDSGGGAAGQPVTLFFGTNNIRACMPIIIDVDLDASAAVVARHTDGGPDCALDPNLVSDGCTATFEELDGGAILQAVIDGCEVPEISNLFGCNFSEADVTAVGASVDAVCDCVGEPLCDWNIFCDPWPAICTSLAPDPSSCEDCSNFVDDNGDGLVDCRDPNCHIEDCGYGQSTITCSTTTTSTTSTTGGRAGSD